MECALILTTGLDCGSAGIMIMNSSGAMLIPWTFI